MLTELELDGMRVTSAAAMPDTCNITRSGGPGVFDEDTGLYDDTELETIYTGPCRVRQRDNQENDTEIGDLHETLGRYVGTLPATLAHAQAIDPEATGDPNDVRVDDFLELTTSSDPTLAGRPIRVIHAAWGSWHIDRRLGLEDREHQPQQAAGS